MCQHTVTNSLELFREHDNVHCLDPTTNQTKSRQQCFLVYKSIACKTRANIEMSSQKQPMHNATGGGGRECGGNSGNDRGGDRGGEGGGGESSGCSKWAKATGAASGNEASTSSGAQTTAEGVLSLGTLDTDALSSIFRSLPVSHDTLQMYANLKAVSRHILEVTRAQMKDEVLRDALHKLWHTFPGTNIPCRAVTVAPICFAHDNLGFYNQFENGSMQWHWHGLFVSSSFQGGFPSFETDGGEWSCLLVELNYDFADLLHPSIVPENPGGMADLSRLPNVIRSCMGLIGLTVPYDSLVHGGWRDYYRAVAVSPNTTMEQVFFAIAGVEGWNTDTYDVPFNMRMQTNELDEDVTVMETMEMAESMPMPTIWIVAVDWPSLSTGVVEAESTFGETTHVEEIASVPPVQEESAALLYDADTNEWSYAK